MSLEKQTLYVGDTFVYTVTIYDVDSAVQDITGATTVWTAKQYDGTNLFTTSVTSHLDAANGQTQFVLSKTTTADFDTGLFDYDVEVTLSSGYRYTALRGILEVRPDMTAN